MGANERRMIIKLWRGQYGLVKTWWLFGVLGTALLNLVSAPLNAAAAVHPMDEIDGIMLTLAALLVAAFGLCYGFVASVGIVRAAQTFRGERVWSWLAVTATATAWLGGAVYVALG